MPIDVLIVDDHKIVREGLVKMLSTEPDIRVVGEAGDGRTALRAVAELSPDVVILDISLPDIAGGTIARRLMSKYPSLKIIVLSMHSDPVFVNDMLQAGVAGYVLKSAAFEDLAHSINVIAANRMYLSPEVTQGVVLGHRELLSKDTGSLISKLTERELEIMRLLAEGHATSQIADLLNISPKTVATHRKNLMDKLGLNNIAELTKFAIREKFVSLDR